MCLYLSVCLPVSVFWFACVCVCQSPCVSVSVYLCLCLCVSLPVSVLFFSAFSSKLVAHYSPLLFNGFLYSFACLTSAYVSLHVLVSVCLSVCQTLSFCLFSARAQTGLLVLTAPGFLQTADRRRSHPIPLYLDTEPSGLYLRKDIVCGRG